MGSQVANGPKELELMEWMSRTALEAIGQAGFGYSFQALDGVEEKENRFTSALKELVWVKL